MKTTDYIVEKAVPGDAAAIARFQIALASETESMMLDSETVTKGVRRVFDDPGIGFYLAARNGDGGAIGCMLILSEWSEWRNAFIWWTHSVYVLPEHRRNGVFSAMFEHLETLARSSDIAGIRLYVEPNNDAAKQVYARMGMEGGHYELYEKMLKIRD